ncbi:hypothetical protein MP638_005198 [Amoeboaphelidium occidentale]|nr:hypothetical protein MP638_005198 [Amoeboaphelidium occidentale]
MSKLLQLNGVLAVCKPSGCTSNDVVNYIKELLVMFQKKPKVEITRHITFTEFVQKEEEIRKSDKKRKFQKYPKEVKIGHGGTLDPLASGVLIVGVGKGTKQLQYFLTSGACVKTYDAVGVLGKSTDSYDILGDVVEEKAYDHVTEDMIKEAIKSKFTGIIEQMPPVYSALKVNGERMYDIARKAKKDGTTVEMSADKLRKVEIYEHELLQFGTNENGEKFFKIRVSCSGGTYIRSIVNDIGLAVGSCAFMSSLERVKQGPFSVTNESNDSYGVVEIEKLTDFNYFKDCLVQRDFMSEVKNAEAIKIDPVKRPASEVATEENPEKKQKV